MTPGPPSAPAGGRIAIAASLLVACGARALHARHYPPDFGQGPLARELGQVIAEGPTPLEVAVDERGGATADVVLQAPPLTPLRVRGARLARIP